MDVFECDRTIIIAFRKCSGLMCNTYIYRDNAEIKPVLEFFKVDFFDFYPYCTPTNCEKIQPFIGFLILYGLYKIIKIHYDYTVILISDKDYSKALFLLLQKENKETGDIETELLTPFILANIEK